MSLALPIERYSSVESWRQRLQEQWGDDPLVEDPGKLEALTDFCLFVDRDPDELLDFCFLRRKATGLRFGSVKRREQIATWLREWRDASGKTGIEARRLTSAVLSFFIHSGVQIHPGMV
jgi:hypothetical protein